MSPLKLYMIRNRRTATNGYWDEIIVAAKNATIAKHIHPNRLQTMNTDCDGKLTHVLKPHMAWPECPCLVICTRIGTASKNTREGMILRSWIEASDTRLIDVPQYAPDLSTSHPKSNNDMKITQNSESSLRSDSIINDIFPMNSMNQTITANFNRKSTPF